ncbi:MAG: hypothetical protein ACREWG_01175 [Gammaproteobacteria bacterium]
MSNFRRILWSCAVAVSLAGCEKTPEQLDMEQRFEVCQVVMGLYIIEAKIYERDQDRLIGGCHIAMTELTLPQWQCVLAGMKKGEKYLSVSDRCRAN